MFNLQEDYRRTVQELDEKEFVSLRLVLCELRNHYVSCPILDVVYRLNITQKKRFHIIIFHIKKIYIKKFHIKNSETFEEKGFSAYFPRAK